MASTEYYKQAEKVRGYRFDKKMNYQSLVNQLNNHNNLSNDCWSANYINNNVVITCEGTEVLELRKHPQRFVFHKDASPSRFNPYEEDLENGYDYSGVFEGYMPYELSIMFHFLRKENWINWFDL